MYPISDRFKVALKQPHVIVSRAEVLDTNFVQQQTLKLVQCNVSVDGSNDIRRRSTCTVVDPSGELIPADYEDLVHPLSNHYIRLFRGIRFPDGTEELVSLGIFDIFDAVVSDTGEEVKAELKLFDLSKRVQRSRLRHNYVVPMGTRYDLAIRDLISYRAPWTSFNFDTVTVVTPQLTFGSSGDQAGGDPWKYASEMAKSIGHELYFDTQGICNLKPVANPKTAPVVWEYHEGEQSQLLYASKTMSKESTFNHVYAFGENSQFTNPVQAEAWDDDPNSPTYRFGPYGSVPTFFISPYIATVEQAQTVADARLLQVLGTTESLQIITTPNPAHEVGDVIEVKRDRAKINRVYVLDKFNINFSAAQAMNATVREVRSV